MREIIHRSIKNLCLVSGLLGLVVGLAACGSDSSPTTSTSTTQVATTTVATTSITVAAQATTNTTTTAGAVSTPPTTVATPGGDATPTATPGTKAGATMKEAFVAVDTQVKGWESDAVYVAIFNNLEKQIGIEPDGRSAEWYFQAVSLKAGRRVTWWAVAQPGGKINVTKSGDEDLPADKLKFQAEQALPPILSLIDTNELMAVARQNGGDKSELPIGFRLAKSAKEGAPLSFDLIFQQAGKSVLIRVDALTGKLLDNARG